MPPPPTGHPGLLLGIEGGATRTVALLANRQLELVQRVEVGPGNLRLLSDRELAGLFRTVGIQPARLDAIAIGLAGARTEADRTRMRRIAGRIWPGIPCACTNDLETALLAAQINPPNSTGRSARLRPDTGLSSNSGTAAIHVLVLSGTGSCCFGARTDGATAKTGGWGHLLGDRGSAYDLALRALRAVIERHDADASWPALGQSLLRKTMLPDPEALIDWAQQAPKDEIAALAVGVLGAAGAGDRLARAVLQEGARALAAQAIACAHRLGAPRIPAGFVFAGGTLVHQPAYAKAVSRLIRDSLPGCPVRMLRTEGAWGAVLLAARRATGTTARGGSPVPPAAERSGTRPGAEPVDLPPPLSHPPLDGLAQAPTEQRNPRSRRLDRLSFSAAIDLFLSEDARLPAALRRERRAIGQACAAIARALRAGGRLFYVGAGTSGRLGVLDASECPPTFGAPPEQVQAIIAGGRRALWESVEGAEDDLEAGGRAVRFRGVRRGDVVVGIAASGRTPFVWGALRAGRTLGATTVLLCFNPALKRLPRPCPHLLIAPNVGPELLTGSTRLKCGTATKMILNLFTTLAMIRLGKVRGNLMIDLNPSNIKLRDRAIRIVRELTGVDQEEARTALERSGWVIRKALKRCDPDPFRAVQP